MEVYTQLREIVQSYNDCIKNIMYINEMMMPRMEEKQPSQHQPIGPCPDPADMCYDCQMQEFGMTLLKAINAHFPSENNNIKPEPLNDSQTQDPYALIELMMLQAKNRDKLNKGLMEEVSHLRQQNLGLNEELIRTRAEIVAAKKEFTEMMASNRFFNLQEKPLQN